MSPSEYSPSLWTALESTLSKGRLTYYLDLVDQKISGKRGEGEKRQKAFELLLWNTHLSESLYLPLQVFEITLRNTMDACISEHYGTGWYRDANWLKAWCTATDRNGRPYVDRALRDIRKAFDDRDKTKRLKRSTEHNHFIAATMLGLWVNFLRPEYEHFWQGILKNAFWPGADRNQLDKVARQSNYVRNRMAHYEPVITKARADDLELDRLHEEILRFIGGVCAETSNWVRKNSRRRFDVAWQEKPHWWPPVGRIAPRP